MPKRENLDVYTSKITNDIFRSLNVATICSVNSLSVDKKTADLQPLPLTEFGHTRPMLINAHVSKNLYDHIEIGSVVVVVFADRNIDNFTGGNEPFPIGDKRSHSLNDCIIVGVL